MRTRRSFVVAVHRWLFRLSVVVVLGSALSRVDNERSDRKGVVLVDDEEADPPPEGGVTLAFVACP
jgi:hypothetical protein